MISNYAWCFILATFLTHIPNIYTKEKYREVIEDLSAVVEKYDNVTLRMIIRWNSKLQNSTQVDLAVTPLENDCSDKPCLEYGLPFDIREYIFPQHPDEIIENLECSILPGCSYNIEVSTKSYSAKKNITFRLPDCVQGICSCKHEKFLPKTHITAYALSANLINVSWSLHPGKISRQHIVTPNISLESIYISVAQLHNPTLTWGGTNNHIYSHRYLLNSTEYNVSKILRNSIRFNTTVPLVSGSHYRIRGYVMDQKGCQGPEGLFILTVPVVKSIQRTRWTLFQVLSALLFIILAAFVVVLLGNCIYKRVHKKKNSSEMSVLHITNPLGSTNIKLMEENPLYADKDNFEISHNSLIIGKLIGEGTFGLVFEAYLHGTAGSTVTVAVKQLKESPTPDEVDEFLGEIQTMKNVGYHENVVTLLGCCTIKEPLMTVMEYVGNGDLLQYLRKIRKKHLEYMGQVSNRNLSVFNTACNSVGHNPPTQGRYLELNLSGSSTISDNSYISQIDVNAANLRPSVTETMYTILSQSSNGFIANDTPMLDYILDNKELHNFALQIVKGMHHLEQKGITHRDLAARNILIDSRKNLKISDFGLSRPGIYVNTKNKKLPLRWLSIEAIRDNFYSNKSDVWAFAVVLWEIGTLGGFPYPTLSNREILPFLSSGERLERPEVSTDFLYDLMLKCWEEELEKRPSFKEILILLQPQKEKIYIDLKSLGPNYVFPPTREEVLDR